MRPADKTRVYRGGERQRLVTTRDPRAAERNAERKAWQRPDTARGATVAKALASGGKKAGERAAERSGKPHETEKREERVERERRQNEGTGQL